MNKLLLLGLLLLAGTSGIYAQHTLVIYDPSRGVFNDNAPLPAEEPFSIQGTAPGDIQMVRVYLIDGSLLLGISAAKVTYSSDWYRGASQTGDVLYEVVFNTPLRSQRQYDLVIAYYRPCTDNERSELLKNLRSSIKQYLDQFITVDKQQLLLAKHPKSTLADLNDLVQQAFSYYDDPNGYRFYGFSSIVEASLNNSDGRKLSTDSSNLDTRAEVVDNLVEAMMLEAQQYVTSDLTVVANQRHIADYPTERVRSTVGIQIGYAGTFFGGDLDKPNYGSAPFAGFAIPWGNAALRGNFLSHTAFNVGVFLTNMEDVEGNTISGPIVKRPVYVGISYRILRFFNVNVGGVLLESQNDNGNFVEVDNIFFRPQVGLSIGIRFWADFEDR